MILLDIIIPILVIYLMYKFVFNFLLPVYQTTKKVQQQFRHMQNSANEQANRTNYSGFQPANRDKDPTVSGKGTGSRAASSSDYIDFEEIK